MKFALIIPTLNAAVWLDELLPTIADQTVKPDQWIVIDSASNDDTAERFARAGASIITIDRKDFDHGSTRQQAVDALNSDIDLVILMTQDALLADNHAFANLLTTFEDPKVGVAYGRQLPRRGATLVEAHARHFSYPDQPDVVDATMIPQRGVRASFCSNSFAAYRVSALRAVQGFPHGCIFGEDQVVAMRLLMAGWRKVYAADSRVFHSHNYTLIEEFRRYFDHGVLHALAPELQSLNASRTSGEGLRYVLSEIDFLWRNKPLCIPDSVLRNGLKFVAYKAGLQVRRVPRGIRPALSMNRRFWTRNPSL